MWHTCMRRGAFVLLTSSCAEQDRRVQRHCHWGTSWPPQCGKWNVLWVESWMAVVLKRIGRVMNANNEKLVNVHWVGWQWDQVDIAPGSDGGFRTRLGGWWQWECSCPPDSGPESSKCWHGPGPASAWLGRGIGRHRLADHLRSILNETDTSQSCDYHVIRTKRNWPISIFKITPEFAGLEGLVRSIVSSPWEMHP